MLTYSEKQPMGDRISMPPIQHCTPIRPQTPRSEPSRVASDLSSSHQGRRATGPRALLIGVLVAALLGPLVAGPTSATSPWDLLAQLRTSLQESGPITGKFVQTYVPAGFSSGDRESGFLSLWLPQCLRWNYQEPETKHFLLCDDEVWFWSDLEEVGRHYRINPEQEPGLDLLLVDVSKLRERYVAESAKLEDGTYQISLATPGDQAQGFAAKIRVDPVSDRVVGLEYTDAEGNLTRFEISDYQSLQHTALFQPPIDMQWSEE